MLMKEAFKERNYLNMIDLTECNSNHIISSGCDLPVSCRSLVNRCGSLGSRKSHLIFEVKTSLGALCKTFVGIELD